MLFQNQKGFEPNEDMNCSNPSSGRIFFAASLILDPATSLRPASSLPTFFSYCLVSFRLLAKAVHVFFQAVALPKLLGRPTAFLATSSTSAMVEGAPFRVRSACDAKEQPPIIQIPKTARGHELYRGKSMPQAIVVAMHRRKTNETHCPRLP